MGYDLTILDLEETPSDLRLLLESIEASSNEVHDPTEKLSAFLKAVQKAFPSLEADTDASPWSVTPSVKASLNGRALGFGISNRDMLFDVLMRFEELAWSYDLIICDPQEGTIRRPRQE